MSADAGAPGGPGGAPRGGSGQPSDDELRAAYEAELSRITSVDMIAQAVVSLLSIGARRLGPIGAPAQEGAAASDSVANGEESAQGDPAAAAAARARAGAERDLEQVRDSIDAVRGLLEILERRISQAELRSLRDALSQLQLAYAREVQAGAEGGAAPTGAERPGEQAPAGASPAPEKGGQPKAPGPAEASGKLWVPGR